MQENAALSARVDEMTEQSLSLFQKRDDLDELEGFQQQELAKVKHMVGITLTYQSRSLSATTVYLIRVMSGLILPANYWLVFQVKCEIRKVGLLGGLVRDGSSWQLQCVDLPEGLILCSYIFPVPWRSNR